MELKTKITAEENKQEILVTRDFDLPVDLLFRAYVDAEIVEQWMGTKVLKLESKPHGSWLFETIDPKGNKHRFNGVIHELVPNQKITRTFEMENTPFGVQLEFYDFEPLTADTSRLRMHTVYRSVAIRNQMLQMGMDRGMNAAHNRLETAAAKYR